MKIYRTASLKNRISQYAITDPRIISFVRKYENLIPWGSLMPAKSFDGGRHMAQFQINDVAKGLLDKLKSRIERGSADSVYVKSVNLEAEAMQNNDNPDIAQAIGEYRNNPAAAEARVLDVVNDGKQATLERWWDYVSGQYASFPTYAFSLLKAVIDSSPETQTTPPPPVNATAVSTLFDSIDGSDRNMMKSYMGEVMEASVTRKSFDDGWVMVPGLPKSEEDEEKWGAYEENLDLLMTYGVSGGWCIGGMHYANEYLEDGDFHILVENGQPTVAIRLNGNRLAEIAGKNNDDIWKEDRWEEIKRFLEKSTINYKNTNPWHKIERWITFNKEREDMTEEDMTDMLTSTVDLGGNPVMVEWKMLSSSNRKKFAGAFSVAAGAMVNRYRKNYPTAEQIEITEEDPAFLDPHIAGMRQIDNTKDIKGNKDRSKVWAALWKGKFFRVWPADSKMPTKDEAYEWARGQSSAITDPDDLRGSINNKIKVAEMLSTMPKEILSGLDVAALAEELREDYVAKVAAGSEPLGITGAAILPLMTEKDWDKIMTGAIDHLVVFASDCDRWPAVKEGLDRYGSRYREKIEEAATVVLVSNNDSLDNLCIDFVHEYTDLDMYMESEREAYDDDFDEDEILRVALDRVGDSLCSVAAELGLMDMIEDTSNMEDVDERYAWETTMENAAADRERIENIINHHNEWLSEANESVLVEIMNNFPDLAGQIFIYGTAAFNPPLEGLSQDAMRGIIADGHGEGLLEYVEGIDLVDLVGIDRLVEPDIIEKKMDEFPEYIGIIDRAIKTSHWDVPSEYIDMYLNENSGVGYGPVIAMAETGNPSVIRRLKQLLSPTEWENYVIGKVPEGVMDEVNRPQPTPSDPNQPELFWGDERDSEEMLPRWEVESRRKEASATFTPWPLTWIERSMVKEAFEVNAPPRRGPHAPQESRKCPKCGGPMVEVDDAEWSGEDSGSMGSRGFHGQCPECMHQNNRMVDDDGVDIDKKGTPRSPIG